MSLPLDAVMLHVIQKKTKLIRKENRVEIEEISKGYYRLPEASAITNVKSLTIKQSLKVHGFFENNRWIVRME